MIYHISVIMYAEEEAKETNLCFFFILVLTGSKRATTILHFSHSITFFMCFLFLSPPYAHARSFPRMAVALLPVLFLKASVVVMASNPRSANGNLRRKHRSRFKAMAAPCGICRGALGPIHYDEPSNSTHPLSFVIDEIRPISRWREFGYDSPEAAARDWTNLQAAHYCCNQAKSNRVLPSLPQTVPSGMSIIDGDW